MKGDLLESSLRWLYPQRCALCTAIGEPTICPACREEMEELDEHLRRFPGGGILTQAWSIFPFEGRAAQAVKRLKYGRASVLAKPMAQIMANAYHRFSLPHHDLIVPVPVHWSRRSFRGFNQSVLLCESLPQEMIRADLLVRSRNTKPQVELTVQQRLSSLHGAFEASPDVKGQSILLVDDVITSGGTALACADALEQAGALKASILTFCGDRTEELKPAE
jgi:ComF family protein